MPGSALLFGFVFAFCGESAADMAFLFIFLDDFVNLCRESCVQSGEPDGDILMYGRF